MAFSKSSKRPHIHVDANTSSDSDSDNLISFPSFIILESLEERPLAKLSPFVIEKVISSRVIPRSVKKAEEWKSIS